MDYPSFSRRYVSAVVDGFVILGMFYVFSESPLSAIAKISPLIVFVIVLLYEPIFTAKLCTLGQLVMRYRVRRLSDLQRIGIRQSLWRYFVKIMLGVVSLLTIPGRKDRRGIHDLASKTIAVNAKTLTIAGNTPAPLALAGPQNPGGL